MKSMNAILILFATIALELFNTQALAQDLQILEIEETNSITEANSDASQYNLLNWKTEAAIRQKPAELYNRNLQFGRWIQFKKTKGCFDTRAQALIRDSVTAATSTDDKKCTIEKGEWHDPYSGQIFFDDNQVQIDHMVPLKEAYLAGAHTWSRAKRCVYANFTGMKDHLITASNFENLSKSDKTPENYIPPNKDYVCTYLKNWLTVKLIWKLSMTRPEAMAIKKHMADYGCKENEMHLQKSFVEEMRELALKLEPLCPVPRKKMNLAATPATPTQN
jgi:hypothetical protein